MNTAHAISLGTIITEFLRQGEVEQAYQALQPTLCERTPFRHLDRLAKSVTYQGGSPSIAIMDDFLQRIAIERSMGGWVVIAGLLHNLSTVDLAGTLRRAYQYIVQADTWYATDTISERVPGPALVHQYDTTLSLIKSWRDDRNYWIRRSVGVAIHLWAKRNRQSPPKAEQLMRFLEPMMQERHIQAIKGIGWGLKTLGRYYPKQLEHWLASYLMQTQEHPRAVLIKKAITYLPAEDKQKILRLLKHGA